MNKLILFVSLIIQVALPILSLGQNGPMGIGNGDGSESPAGYYQPRLLLWLDGSKVETAGNYVTQWTDQSGNGHHFIAESAVNRPTYFAVGGPANTPYLSFDGNQNRLHCPNFSFPSSGYSIYFVVKSVDSKYGIFSYASATEPHEINIYNDNGFRQQAGPNDRSSAIGNINGSNWNYGGLWWNNSSDILWEYNRSNGSLGETFETFAPGFNLSENGSAVIGDIQNSLNGGYVAGNAFAGQIAEVIIWEGVMTKPIGRMMRSYMHNKYGIDANSANWDKFQSKSPGSQGEYYTPIAVGMDNTGNPGAHYESRLNGLVLRVNPGEFNMRSYMGAGQATADVNSIIASAVPGVEHQWSRAWEIAGSDGNQIYQIGFDFGEGIINGKIPQNIDNYVLLQKTGPGGNYSEFTSIISKAIIDDEVVFRIDKSNLASNNKFYTIGTKNSNESSLLGSVQRTWYAYQSGNWDDPTTWTLDGSAAPAFINPFDGTPGSGIPAGGDNIYIGSGRKVTVPATMPLYGSLKVFGTLDVASAPAPAFLSIGGNGLIRCAGSGTAGNFPIGNSTAFANAFNGGTVEFYGNGGFTQNSDILVNKLKINLDDPMGKITLSSNLTHNGLFEINKGTLEIHNATSSRTITSNANVLVESDGYIKVGSSGSVRKHVWNFEKDFIIEGNVRFTTRIAPGYDTNESNQYIEARFVSAVSNQELSASGNSYFSRIVVNKGVDMTYVLRISGAPDKFQLLGPCNGGMVDNPFLGETSNNNSFALINGTAEIKENIFIPLHYNSGNYNINQTAMLWVNGGEVTKGFPSGNQAIVVYGSIKISSGLLNANCTSGLTMRGNGLLQIDGGVLNANQIRTSVLGAENIGGVVINGGKVNIDGNASGGTNSLYYTFSLTYPGNLFRMTGGELYVKGPTSKGLLFINSDPANTSVTGGTVILEVSDNNVNQTLSSRAAFWNLSIQRSATTGTNRPIIVSGGTSGSGSGGDVLATMQNQNLHVRNNLSIIGENDPVLQMGNSSFVADLYLDGNLTIESGGVYDHNTNTTHFVGNANSLISLSGTTRDFNNIIVNKSADAGFVRLEPGGSQLAMNVLGNFNLEKGFFNNAGHDIEVKGNITNRSKFGVEGSTGYVRMKGYSGAQQIISDNGIFQKLVIDNPDGVVLSNDGLTIRNSLNLENGSFFIGDNKLRLDGINPYLSFSDAKFIVCSGNASAGGVEILNSIDGQELEYKFGVNSATGQKYTPVLIKINGGFSDDGYIRVAPVDTVIPTAGIDGGGNYLNYYWRVTHSGYAAVPKVSHRFQYHPDDIRGEISDFVSGRVLSVLPFNRSVDELPVPASEHIDLAQNAIYYNGEDVDKSVNGIGTPLVNADYSAGDELRFTGRPLIYFSKNDITDADWNNPLNWNELGQFSSQDGVYQYHSSAIANQSGIPQGGDIAIIGFDVDNQSERKPHVYKAPLDGIEASVVLFTPLQDNTGNRMARYSGSGILNLGIFRPTLKLSSNSDISKVQQISGEGALWLETDIDLGVSDIGAFLAEDSAMIILSPSLQNFNFLPVNIPNLILVKGTSTVTSDINIRGNLEIWHKAKLLLSTTNKGDITVNGNCILKNINQPASSATLQYRKGKIHRTVTVKKDLIISGSGSNIEISGAMGPPVNPVEWNPAEIEGYLWFDASETSNVLTDGNKVIEWLNKGAGSAFNFSQNDGAKQPSYIPGGLNGLHTIRFDGMNDFLAITHNDLLNINANQNFEIFTVIRQNSGSGYRAIYAKGEVGAHDFLLYVVGSNQYKLYVDQSKIDMTAPNNMQGNANLGWARRQGSNSALYNTLGGNKLLGTTAAASNQENTWGVTLGAAKNGSTRFFNGDIAEVILVKRALTTDERQQMEGYLAHKWGLQNDLPAGHPYKNSKPMTGGANKNLSNQLIVEGNILQKPGGSMNLFLIATDTTYVNLILHGEGNHSYINTSGNVAKFWKIEVDKGNDLTSSFSVHSNFDLFGPSNETEKSLILKNGLLKLDHASINLTLSSGGSDFQIPSTAGLHLNSGLYKIKGTDTGLLLDGLLKITGGTFNIGDNDNQNNYIEYTSSGYAKILVEGGNLLVGSQIRRGLTNTGGILKYSQSGGDVQIGRYSAPALNRGMLEVINTGSSFEHTGGVLTFVRGINSNSTASLLIDTPSLSNVSGNSEIRIGNENSPSGTEIQNFGIKSSVPLNKLSISNTSGHNPVVHLISIGLRLKNNLFIDQHATFNCQNQDLILMGDVTNNGILTSVDSKVTFSHSSVGEVSGTGVFSLFNLERTGGNVGLTTVSKDLLVENSFTLDAGTIDFGNNSLTVKGDVIADGEIIFSSASSGLIFDGLEEQKLKRSANSGTTKISVITIDNPQGVVMNNGAGYHFIVNKKLRLSRGVFKLQGNLLELGLGADIEELNSFSKKNMISTGGAFTNFGVLKNIAANSTQDIFIPIGIEEYMPVRLDFAQPDFSSGSTNSSYLFKINVPEHPIRIDDGNVLGMYFTLDASNVGTGLKMGVQFHYHDSYVQTTGSNTEGDYLAARVYNGQVSKFGQESVNENLHTITLDFINKGEEGIDGDYFAGVDAAIPNIIPEYHTVTSGAVGSNVYDVGVPGGGAPSGADVYIEGNDELTFDQSNINFYRTFITENATLIIDGTSFHRLGKVTGNGTIHLIGTGTLPSGEYASLFTCGGGKLIYEGRNGDEFEILSNLPNVRKVEITGHMGSKIKFSNNDVNICEDLTISGPLVKGSDGSLIQVNQNLNISQGTLNMGQGNLIVGGKLNLTGGATSGGVFASGNQGLTTINGDLNIGGKQLNLGTAFRTTEVKGNLLKTSGIISGGTGGARLKMSGNAPQYIKGDFTGSSRIPLLHISNESGIALYNNVEISNSLKLELGNVKTAVDSLIILTADGTVVDPVGGSPASYVNGPMRWSLNQGATERIFPIGSKDRYRPVQVVNRSATRTWEAQYYDTVAIVQNSILSMEPNLLSTQTIDKVSIQEHWRINHSGGNVQARVYLSWGENSAVSALPANYEKLLVLSYNTGSQVWDSYGGTNFSYDPGTETGKFRSAQIISFSERFFTLGSSDGINPLPVTWLHFGGTNNGDEHILEWATATEQNNDYFALERSIDAKNWWPVAKISGAGFSTKQSNYSYTDKEAPYGRVYYRLIQVDFDGRSEINPNLVSLEKLLQTTVSKLEFELYPNPTKYSTVRMILPGFEDAAVSIMISDMSGKKLSDQIIQIDGQGISHQIDCNFDAGIYLVTVIAGDKMRSKPLVISK